MMALVPQHPASSDMFSICLCRATFCPPWEAGTRRLGIINDIGLPVHAGLTSPRQRAEHTTCFFCQAYRLRGSWPKVRGASHMQNFYPQLITLCMIMKICQSAGSLSGLEA